MFEDCLVLHHTSTGDLYRHVKTTNKIHLFVFGYAGKTWNPVARVYFFRFSTIKCRGMVHFSVLRAYSVQNCNFIWALTPKTSLYTLLTFYSIYICRHIIFKIFVILNEFVDKIVQYFNFKFVLFVNVAFNYLGSIFHKLLRISLWPRVVFKYK